MARKNKYKYFNPERLRKNVKQLRQHLGLTQDAFGKEINLNRVNYSQFEQGIITLNHDAICAIYKKYRLTFEQLVFDEDILNDNNEPNNLFEAKYRDLIKQNDILSETVEDLRESLQMHKDYKQMQEKHIKRQDEHIEALNKIIDSGEGKSKDS